MSWKSPIQECGGKAASAFLDFTFQLSPPRVQAIDFFLSARQLLETLLQRGVIRGDRRILGAAASFFNRSLRSHDSLLDCIELALFEITEALRFRTRSGCSGRRG